MQEINAEYDRAKKRLGSGFRDSWDPFGHKANTREEQARQQQQYRNQVDRQKQKLKEELQWALEQVRSAQAHGLLRDCQLYRDEAASSLKIGGNTWPYRVWFREHGFRWNPDKKQWYFYKKPLFSSEEESEGDEDDNDN
jgi:hypothetical protein